MNIDNHKLVLLKLFNEKQMLRIFIANFLLDPKNVDNPAFEAAKKVYKNNFSLNSFVNFYNIRWGTKFSTNEIENLLLLQ